MVVGLRAIRYDIYLELVWTGLLGQTCEACVWVEHDNTQVVQTAWAAMALHVCAVPRYGADQKSCGVGHVAPTAGTKILGRARCSLVEVWLA